MTFAPAISAVLVWGLVRSHTTRPYIWTATAATFTFLIIYVTERQLATRSTSNATPRDNAPSGDEMPRPERESVVAQGPGAGLSSGSLAVGIATHRDLTHIFVKAALATLQLAPSVAAVVYILANNASQPFPSSDGGVHALEIRELAETGRLPASYTYLLVRSDESGVTHRPIDHPLTFYVVSSFFWMLGGIKALYAIPALSGALTVLFSYLLTRRILPSLAFFIAPVMLLVVLQRYTMVVLLEQLLLPAMLAAIYFYVRFLEAPRESRLKYALLAGAMLGLSVAIKQQGWILAAALVVHAVGTIGIRALGKRRLDILAFALLGAVAIAVLFVPIADLTQRNGSFLGSDWTLPTFITKTVPYMTIKPEYNIDPEAVRVLSKSLGYWIAFPSPLVPLREFVTTPLLPVAVSDMPVVFGIWTVLASLFIAAVILYRLWQWTVIPVVVVVLLVDLAVTFRNNDDIRNYHQLGLSLFAMLEIAGAVLALRLLVSRGLKSVTPICVALLVAFLLVGFNVWIGAVHQRSWRSPLARETPEATLEYKELGDYMQANIPKTP